MSGDDNTNDAWIPCDACDTLVRFSQYSAHVQECQREAIFSPAFVFSTQTRLPLPSMQSIQMMSPFVNMLMNQYMPNAQTNAADAADAADADDADDGDTADTDDTDDASGSGDVDAASIPIPIPAPLWAVTVAALNADALGYEALSALSSIIGTVDRGVPDVDAALSTVATDRMDMAVADRETCPICQENADRDDPTVMNVSLRKCGHLFCDGCIRTWLARNPTCPVCMVDLRDADSVLGASSSSTSHSVPPPVLSAPSPSGTNGRA